MGGLDKAINVCYNTNIERDNNNLYRSYYFSHYAVEIQIKRRMT